MLLRPVPVMSTQFTWVASEKKFVTEISDLGKAFTFGQVWDDACDEGLTLVSRYPGHEDIVFAVDHEERNREGDVLWWDLVPADLTTRNRTPWSLRIYND